MSCPPPLPSINLKLGLSISQNKRKVILIYVRICLNGFIKRGSTKKDPLMNLFLCVIFLDIIHDHCIISTSYTNTDVQFTLILHFNHVSPAPHLSNTVTHTLARAHTHISSPKLLLMANVLGRQMNGRRQSGIRNCPTIKKNPSLITT